MITFLRRYNYRMPFELLDTPRNAVEQEIIERWYPHTKEFAVKFDP